MADSVSSLSLGLQVPPAVARHPCDGMHHAQVLALGLCSIPAYARGRGGHATHATPSPPFALLSLGGTLSPRGLWLPLTYS